MDIGDWLSAALTEQTGDAANLQAKRVTALRTQREKAGIPKRVASNFTLEGENLFPTHKKPFSSIAEGLPGSNWLTVLDDIRNWLMKR